MFDIKIFGGTVVDGSGKEKFLGDIGIIGDRITSIGDLSESGGHQEIDATGLAVLPGFIDTHSHADGVLLKEPQGIHSIRQGVTSEILTQDGMGWAPLDPISYQGHARYLAGILGDPPLDLDMSSISALRGHYDRKTGPNVAVLVPHGPVRLSVLGFTDAPMQGENLVKAQKIIRKGLDEGAVGLSTGLSYYPQSYSDTEELLGLCEPLKDLSRVYVTHVRNHNNERAKYGSGIDEALAIARIAEVKVHISHFMTRPTSAGQVKELMAPIDEAKSMGADVTLECYPYAANATIPGYFLRGEFHEGGIESLLQRLGQDDNRAKMIDSLHTLFPGALGQAAFTRMISEKNRSLTGFSFADVASERKLSIEEMIIEVMLEEQLACGFRAIPPSSVSVTRQIESDVIELLGRDDYMLGSDGIPLLDGEGLPHPRAYGSFARVIGPLRRRHKVPIEELTHRLTSLPAERFGLTDRGILQEGAFADIVVLDDERVHDLASFEDPVNGPTGIEYVLVNGTLAVNQGILTGDLAGRAIP